MGEYLLRTLLHPDVSQFDLFSVLLRVLFSLLAGAAVGFERGNHGREAGLRTHVLLCVSAALSSMTGIFMTANGLGDSSRVAAGVASGIGFLCAGIILNKNNRRVTGLTTAAAMYTTMMIGLAFGAGFFIGGILVTVLLMICLTWMTRMETRHKTDLRYYLELDDAYCTNEMLALICEKFAAAHSFDVGKAKSGMERHIGLYVSIPCADRQSVLQTLSDLPHAVFVIAE